MGLPLTDSATVSMSIRDFRAAENEIDSLRAENVDLRKNGVAVTSDPTLDPVRDLRALLDAALPVIQLAVGNLDPATVIGWPHNDLVTVADLIERIYPGDVNLQSLAIEFRTFAHEAKRINKFRAERHKAAVDHVEAAEASEDAVSATLQLESGNKDPIEIKPA